MGKLPQHVVDRHMTTPPRVRVRIATTDAPPPEPLLELLARLLADPPRR